MSFTEEDSLAPGVQGHSMQSTGNAGQGLIGKSDKQETVQATP